MNRRLLDPFQAVELPEVIEEYLESGTARCIAFNRRGTLLAAGTEEGQIVVWDFDTRGVAKVYDGHSKAVTCLCWSRNGKRLLSGSSDQTVIFWNVLQGTQECRVEVGAAVTHVSLSRTEPYFALISIQLGAALRLDLQTQQYKPLPYATLDQDASTSKAAGRPDGPTSNKHMVAILNKASDTIICGQAKGLVVFLDVATQNVLDIIRIPNAPRVSGLILNRQGKYLLLNCHDRVIRLVELHSRERLIRPGYTQEELSEALTKSKVPTGPVPNSALWPKEHSLISPVHSFQNVVDRPQWRSACFSGDSEHVIGAALRKDAHNIYIWNRLYGKLERILEGPREGIGEVAWHPLRSILTSVTPQGRIFVWAKIYNENWSAFAPDFKELDENKEYVEREDEFDLNERQEATENGHVDEDLEDEDIDIMTAERIEVLSSDEEDDCQQLHYLPVTIEKAADGEEEDGVRLDGNAEGGGLARMDSGRGPTQGGEEFAEGDDGMDEETGPGHRKRRVRWEVDWSDLAKRRRT